MKNIKEKRHHIFFYFDLNLMNLIGNPPFAISGIHLGSNSTEEGVLGNFSTEKFMRIRINANFVLTIANRSPEIEIFI